MIGAKWAKRNLKVERFSLYKKKKKKSEKWREVSKSSNRFDRSKFRKYNFCLSVRKEMSYVTPLHYYY